jgi:hypothetical protein
VSWLLFTFCFRLIGLGGKSVGCRGQGRVMGDSRIELVELGRGGGSGLIGLKLTWRSVSTFWAAMISAASLRL